MTNIPMSHCMYLDDDDNEDVKTTKLGVAYMDSQADGAYPNGSRVTKIRTYDPVEVHPIGSTGSVLGSIPVPQGAREQMKRDGVPFEPSHHMYFVAWDAAPDAPTVIVADKIELIHDTH